jgi:hypothetical protein
MPINRNVVVSGAAVDFATLAATVLPRTAMSKPTGVSRAANNERRHMSRDEATRRAVSAAAARHLQLVSDHRRCLLVAS